MDDIEREQVRRLVEELDRRVPREGAAVRLDHYGGEPVECGFVGTRNGYLRYGVELLKAGLAEPEQGLGPAFDVEPELEYLLSPESEVAIQEFVRDEELKPLPAGKRGGTAVGLVLGLGCLFVLACLVVGFVTIAGWLWEILT
jgi:hypothetical protein